MMQFSLMPLLFLTVFILIVLHARTVAKANLELNQGYKRFWGLWMILLAWGFASSFLAINGYYRIDAFYSLYPGLWFPFISYPVIGAFLLDNEVRAFVFEMLNRKYYLSLVKFQALRLLALGTIIKAIIGTFPVYFAVLTGIPDFLFALFAFWLGFIAKEKASLAWEKRFYFSNLLGILVIVPAAPLIQLGLPSPFRYFDSLPTVEVAFTFPTNLAPTLVVPLFVIVNLLTLIGAKLRTAK